MSAKPVTPLTTTIESALEQMAQRLDVDTRARLRPGVLAARWRRRKDFRPRELLEGAFDLFIERGFAETRIEDIAARAGVSKGTVYLYFKNKEGVFRSVIRELIVPAVEALENLAAHHDGPASNVIRQIILFGGELLTSARLRFVPRLVLGEAARFPELVAHYRSEVVDRGLALVTRLISRGIDDGEFRKVDPVEAARLVMAPLVFGAVWATVLARNDEERLVPRSFLATHADTILRGLAADPHPLRTTGRSREPTPKEPTP